MAQKSKKKLSHSETPQSILAHFPDLDENTLILVKTFLFHIYRFQREWWDATPPSLIRMAVKNEMKSATQMGDWRERVERYGKPPASA